MKNSKCNLYKLIAFYLYWQPVPQTQHPNLDCVRLISYHSVIQHPRRLSVSIFWPAKRKSILPAKGQIRNITEQPPKTVFQEILVVILCQVTEICRGYVKICWSHTHFTVFSSQKLSGLKISGIPCFYRHSADFNLTHSENSQTSYTNPASPHPDWVKLMSQKFSTFFLGKSL